MEERKLIVLLIGTEDNYDIMNSYARNMNSSKDSNIYAIVLELKDDETDVDMLNGKSLIDAVDIVIAFTDFGFNTTVYNLIYYTVLNSKNAFTTKELPNDALYKALQSVIIPGVDMYRFSLKIHGVIPSFSVNIIVDDDDYDRSRPVIDIVKERIMDKYSIAIIREYNYYEYPPLSDITIVYNKNDHEHVDAIDAYINKMNMLGDLDSNKLYFLNLYPGGRNESTTLFGGYYFKYTN